MQRARWSYQILLLASVLTLAQAGSTIAEAAVPSLPGDMVPAAVVLRGAVVPRAEVPPVSDGDPPIVLRGSPPSPAQSHATPPTCAAALDYDGNYGCMSPGYAYAPDYCYWPDYGYWPYFGLGRVDNGRRRGFHHGFAQVRGRGPALGFGMRAAGAFAHGGAFAHAGGFGHR